MGVEYSAKIVVGLPMYEFEDRDQIEEFGLDVVAPYYDGDSKGVAGIVVECSGDYSRKEIDVTKLAADIEAAKKEFFKITGRFGIAYLSTCGH